MCKTRSPSEVNPKGPPGNALQMVVSSTVSTTSTWSHALRTLKWCTFRLTNRYTNRCAIRRSKWRSPTDFNMCQMHLGCQTHRQNENQKLCLSAILATRESMIRDHKDSLLSKTTVTTRLGSPHACPDSWSAAVLRDGSWRALASSKSESQSTRWTATRFHRQWVTRTFPLPTLPHLHHLLDCWPM